MTKPISTLTTEYQAISTKKKSLETEQNKLVEYMATVDTTKVTGIGLDFSQRTGKPLVATVNTKDEEKDRVFTIPYGLTSPMKVFEAIKLNIEASITAQNNALEAKEEEMRQALTPPESTS